MSRETAAQETTESEASDEETVTASAEEGTTVYDESYTVAQLREAAKARGITGYSSMTKAQLLEVLNGD